MPLQSARHEPCGSRAEERMQSPAGNAPQNLERSLHPRILMLVPARIKRLPISDEIIQAPFRGFMVRLELPRKKVPLRLSEEKQVLEINREAVPCAARHT